MDFCISQWSYGKSDCIKFCSLIERIMSFIFDCYILYAEVEIYFQMLFDMMSLLFAPNILIHCESILKEDAYLLEVGFNSPL